MAKVYGMVILCSWSTAAWCGKLVKPWRSTTAIVKAGESFDVWFDADGGQTVSAVELEGPYNAVSCSRTITTGDWEYDPMSGNRYDTRITVTVPAGAPADRYDVVLKTTSGDEISYGGVKVVSEFKDSYYVMHMSDGHLYQANYDTDVLLARKSAMLDIADIMDVQLIIETGDNMYNVRNHPEREGYYFLGKDDIGTRGMARASAATFLTAGDHTGYYANDWANDQATEQINADFVNDYWGVQNSSVKYGNGRFMMFNNAWAVSATSAGTLNDSTILSLDESEVDLRPFVQLIADSGFEGPIGFINFQMPYAPVDYLTRTMARWNELCEEVGLYEVR